MKKNTSVAVLAVAAVAVGLAGATSMSASAAPAAAGVRADATCGSLPATREGTEGPDSIRATSGADIIAALGGDDVVSGLGGRDRICLGPGRDIGQGGADSDEFIAEARDSHRDDYYGDDGEDSVRFLGRTVGLTISLDGLPNDGEPGENDNVRPSTENVQGGNGDDTILGNDERNVFIGGRGDDDLRGGLGRDELYGVQGNDLMIGNDGNDDLSGDTGNDTVQAAALPDGGDLFFGGPDFDTMSYAGRNLGFGVSVVLDNLYNDGSTDEFDNIRTDVEKVIGSSGRDVIEAGTPTDDVLNWLVGGPGNDTLRSVDGGFDIVDGGPGLDLCFTDPGDTRIGCELP